MQYTIPNKGSFPLDKILKCSVMHQRFDNYYYLVISLDLPGPFKDHFTADFDSEAAAYNELSKVMGAYANLYASNNPYYWPVFIVAVLAVTTYDIWWNLI